MDLPGTEADGRPHGRRRQRVAGAAAVAVVALGFAAVSITAYTDRGTARVVASSTAGPYAAGPSVPVTQTTTARPQPTTTLAPPSTARAVAPPAAPVATTALTVATTTPPTAPPTTARYVPPAPPTTVAVMASLQVSPGTANFPSTPPPYWPMPIVNVTVTNTGGVTLRSVVVHPVGVYSVPSSTCSTLLPGRSCVAEVQFCPSSPNHYVNALLVTGEDAATGSALGASITLNGTAT